MTTTRTSTVRQSETKRIFRSLHEREGAFIIPNPWDVGTARLLAHVGFGDAIVACSAAIRLANPDRILWPAACPAHKALSTGRKGPGPRGGVRATCLQT